MFDFHVLHGPFYLFLTDFHKYLHTLVFRTLILKRQASTRGCSSSRSATLNCGP